MQITTTHRSSALSVTQERLLAAIPTVLQCEVRRLLNDPRTGGRGLRAWLTRIEVDDAALPSELPAELVEVYLVDQEAEPLHDCEECGLSVPVRRSGRIGREPVVEHEYFPYCPCCGGRTGRYAYWSRGARREAGVSSYRPRQPR